MKDFKSLFKGTKFIYLWGSQLLSQITINILNFVLLIRLFEVTGSSIATSLLWISYALPALIIGPFAAASVDIYDRRKLLIMTNVLQALTILIYALIHGASTYLLYGVAVVYSLLNEFYIPAEAASLPSLVKKEKLPHANGLFFMTQQMSLVVGFGLAGVLLTIFGFTKVLYLSSFLLLLASISVSFLPKMKVKKELVKFEDIIFHFFERITEGFRFIREHRRVLVPFLLLIGVQVAFTIVVVNVPLLAKTILKINPSNAGYMVVVPAGIGAAIGSIYIPRLLKKGVRKKKVIENSLTALAVCFLLLTYASKIFPWPYNVVVGVLTIIPLGFSFVGVIVPSQTFLQEVTPGGMRGRVFGNFWFMVKIATVFPVVFSGAISELLGIETLLTVLVGVIIMGLVFSKKYSSKILPGSVN